ncbi:MAG: c-type cytochrome domain-containing protein [Bacteroidia bacterium]
MKKYTLGTFWLLAITLTVAISACKHDVPEPVADNGNNGNNGGGNNNGIPCDSDSVYFNSQILPILISNCTSSGCHDVASHEEGIILTNYTNVMNTAGITPGNPSAGDIMDVITTNDPGDRMPPPPATRLTTAQTQLIQTWIAQGAQDLNCSGQCDTSNVTYTATIKPLVQTYCKGCHSGSAPGGGVDLSNYAGVSGSAFDGSLIGSIDHLPGWSAMPKNSAKMSDCDVAKFKIWVNAGAPNN